MIFLLANFCLIAQNTSQAYTNEFPNYHPLVVHFPLILLIIATLMQFVVVYKKIKIYNLTVAALTILGFISAVLAATVFHAEPAHNINPVAKRIFESHQQFAFITLVLIGIASLIKIAGAFWVDKRWIEITALLILSVSAVTVSIAGHHGSELVYKHGIGAKGEMLEEDHHH